MIESHFCLSLASLCEEDALSARECVEKQNYTKSIYKAVPGKVGCYIMYTGTLGAKRVLKGLSKTTICHTIYIDEMSRS